MRTGFFGWRVVAAAFTLAVFGWGVGFYGPPVYLHTVQATRGWSVALVSTAVTVHFLIGAAVVANLPRLYRRFGLPRTTWIGAVSLAAGVAGWALAREPWQLLLASVLSGAGWVAMGAAAVNAIIAPWFIRRRPAALATAYNGASIGGVIFTPLWVLAIAHLGFAIAAGLIGGIMIVTVGLLACFVLSRTPQAMGQAPDGNTDLAESSPTLKISSLPGRALWSDRCFLTLAAAMALGLFAQIGLIAHLFSLLVPVLGDAGAGVLMGLATAAAIAGRTLVGWLMPAGGNRRLFAVLNHAVQIAGSLALIAAGGQHIGLIWIGVLLFGAGIGNTTSMPPLIAQMEFSEDDIRRVVPLIVAIGQAGYAFAPAVFGALRTPGSPDGTAVFVAAVIIQVLAACAYLAALTPNRRRVAAYDR